MIASLSDLNDGKVIVSLSDLNDGQVAFENKELMI